MQSAHSEPDSGFDRRQLEQSLRCVGVMFDSDELTELLERFGLSDRKFFRGDDVKNLALALRQKSLKRLPMVMG